MSQARTSVTRTPEKQPTQEFSGRDQKQYQRDVAALLEVGLPAVGAPQSGKQLVSTHPLPAFSARHVIPMKPRSPLDCLPRSLLRTRRCIGSLRTGTCPRQAIAQLRLLTGSLNPWPLGEEVAGLPYSRTLEKVCSLDHTNA